MQPILSDDAKTGAQRLLIVRLGSMGDIIHTLPAVTALCHAMPDAILGWLVEERWAELLCTLPTPRSGSRSPQRPLLDRVHTVNTRNWRGAPLSVQTWEQMAAALSELRAPGYQDAVDLQGAIRSAVLARWSGAPTVWGVAQARENAASMFYTRQVIVSGTHVIEQNMSLARAVAQKPLEIPKVEFPHDEAAEVACDARLRQLGQKDFALINPGAGWGAKQWPAERYADVAKKLAADRMPSLVNFGPGEEKLAAMVEQASEGAAKAVSCSITELIALTRRARLFIGGDTGPMHLAAALGIPVVAIFGPTNPARNGPFGTASIVLRSPESSTTHKRRSQPDQGLLQVGAADVLAAARQLLEGYRG